MRPGLVRVPLAAVALALLGLIALLATLQYRWLGRISDAERDRMKTTLNARATEFAQDVDRELTRAYLLFQVESGDASRLAERYDRWEATARFPRLIKDVYRISGDDPDRLERFDPGTRAVTPVAWPPALEHIRQQAASIHHVPSSPGVVIRTVMTPIVEDIPAIVVAAPLMFSTNRPPAQPFDLRPSFTSVVLVLDRDEIAREMLPALARAHFRGTGDGFDYDLAVLRSGGDVVYRSDDRFAPARDARGDASVDFFQVRAQDFSSLVSEVRRFTTVTVPGDGAVVTQSITRTGSAADHGAPLSVFVQQGSSKPLSTFLAGIAASVGRQVAAPEGKWRLVVEHPSGSLEAAVNSARRRNLAVSSGILAVLGISVGLLVVSTRRAQDLARRQLEFVATVSHELRTPLAVIRSAAENLADGVVHDEARIRQYGELVRSEGRRLTDLVEQILEYAGLQSGKAIPATPVSVSDLLTDVAASAAPLAQAAGMSLECELRDDLGLVQGDAPALRRAFENLVSNAIKYGAPGRWVGVAAVNAASGVEVSVSDRGIGIATAEQSRIFEPFYRTPDVVAAQIHGAGLGLSLVKRIVEAHGGRVTVKSAPGEGSTFTVVLPRAAGSPDERAAGVGAPAPQHSS